MKEKIETASKREEKIRELSRRIGKFCADFYDRATQEQKETMFKMLVDLDESMIAYREHKKPWDSKLIDAEETFYPEPDKKETVDRLLKDGETDYETLKEFGYMVKTKTKKFDETNTVMDKARELFAFVSTK